MVTHVLMLCQVEACRAEMEEDFEISTLSAGLMERVRDTLATRYNSYQSDKIFKNFYFEVGLKKLSILFSAMHHVHCIY